MTITYDGAMNELIGVNLLRVAEATWASISAARGGSPTYNWTSLLKWTVDSMKHTRTGSPVAVWVSSDGPASRSLICTEVAWKEDGAGRTAVMRTRRQPDTSATEIRTPRIIGSGQDSPGGSRALNILCLLQRHIHSSMKI